MNGGIADALAFVAETARRFQLDSLLPTLEACQALHRGGTIDLAVLGQFKSGKSSLLNAVVGHSVLPVGALPVTAVITRIVAGAEWAAQITFVNGTAEKINVDRLEEFVTEAANPNNQRHAAIADVFAPTLQAWPQLRLVDTPGLYSVFAHNTAATRQWMPYLTAAAVTVSAERPLSAADIELIDEARRSASRVVVIVTKIDLLSERERADVLNFVRQRLRDRFDADISVFPFSTRTETARWLNDLRTNLIDPIAAAAGEERERALATKLQSLVRACQDYLRIALEAAERSDANRQRLRAAIFNETTDLALAADEIALLRASAQSKSRPAFEEFFLRHNEELAAQLRQTLAAQLQHWRGSLTTQTREYERWLQSRLVNLLAPISANAAAPGHALLAQVEARLRRIVEAFRDRISRNIFDETGISVSQITWVIKEPNITAVPIAADRTFMTDWDLISWLIPMRMFAHYFAAISWRKYRGRWKRI